ncbi:RHES-like protein [Mya arenaria]|uniref:RHES-like protein n=1 Tax=Mya arenaria TaxID=6604 RepID=A0ABY7DLR0_MYAAR|nr:GTP-binding protein Rhes-like [Mya arenaria]WAQ97285.1 RHES-like protein [Mya arenaria]
MSLLDKGDNAPPENCKRLVILGSSNVGKTSIVSRFLHNKFEEAHTPTIENFHRKVYKIRRQAYRLDILDTAGILPCPATRRLSYATGDLFILVYDITSRESFLECHQILEQLYESKRQQLGSNQTHLPIPVMLVGNKLDADHARTVHSSEGRSLASSDNRYFDVLEVSAKLNINIVDIFVRLFQIAELPTEMCPQAHRKVTPSYPEKSSRKGWNIRRKVSEACGVVQPNPRRPSVGTDLKAEMAMRKVNRGDSRDTKCAVQ